MVKRKKVKGKKCRVLYKGNNFAFFKQNNYKGNKYYKKYKNPSEGVLDMYMF
jgi:hypothetical protein